MTLNASNYTGKGLDVRSRPAGVSVRHGTGGSCVQTVRLQADGPLRDTDAAREEEEGSVWRRYGILC